MHHLKIFEMIPKVCPPERGGLKLGLEEKGAEVLITASYTPPDDAPNLKAKIWGITPRGVNQQSCSLKGLQQGEFLDPRSKGGSCVRLSPEQPVSFILHTDRGVVTASTYRKAPDKYVLTMSPADDKLQCFVNGQSVGTTNMQTTGLYQLNITPKLVKGENTVSCTGEDQIKDGGLPSWGYSVEVLKNGETMWIGGVSCPKENTSAECRQSKKTEGTTFTVN